MKKKVFLDTHTYPEARELLARKTADLGLSPLPEEVIPVMESRGRMSARPVFARYSSPFFHSAAMDGYAVRYIDTFGASETSPLTLRIGDAARPVDTGDPMPEGFNAVVMIEDVNVAGDNIEIYEAVTPYQHVRPVGEDIVATELIIPQNHVIRPIDMGAMLASGNLEVAVRRRPRVIIIPTGSEIIEPEVVRQRMPHPPEIIEYNSAVLAGLAEECGATVTRSRSVPDNLGEIRDAIGQAVAGADVVLVNAGSGRGSEDYTARAIEAIGEVVLQGLSMKPGKPFIAGFVNGKPVFGVPGYPVSAYITFELFVRPLLEGLLGIGQEDGERVEAILSRPVSSSLGVDEFVRVKVGAVGEKHIATPVGRGAGLLMSLVRADGILKIPSTSEGYEQGTKVKVELIRRKRDIDRTIVCIGSHDNTLDILANALKQRRPDYSLSSAHVGSMGGLIALRRGEAHVAGTHLLDEETGEYNVPFLKKVLGAENVLLVNLVYRQQGLVVRKGNPKKILSLADLARDDVAYINRQAGSGTRLLLDGQLRKLVIDPRRIRGYEREEYTHMSVASAVLTGLADAGLAVFSSAVALGLDFIPVADERYDLAIPRRFADSDMIRIMLDIIREDREFRETVLHLGGYDVKDMGKVISGG
jgi:putative molybdopterin biosynthesis protein